MPELQGSFSTLTNNGMASFPVFLNLFDPGVSTAAAKWSSGATNILQLPVGPTLSKLWTVTGWSVRFNGIMMAGNSPPFGRLGKVLASLILGSGGAAPGLRNAFTSPPQAALANAQTVWDGTSDPPFPFFDPANMTQLPATEGFMQTTFQLPQPQTLAAGEQLALGLWLTPSLVASLLNISVYNAQYSVTYSS